jgi:hypothetical protein
VAAYTAEPDTPGHTRTAFDGQSRTQPARPVCLLHVFRTLVGPLVHVAQMGQNSGIPNVLQKVQNFQQSCHRRHLDVEPRLSQSVTSRDDLDGGPTRMNPMLREE